MVSQTGPLQGTDAEIIAPIYNSDSHDTVCGRNATGTGYLPKTATVHAGDTVGFGVGKQQIPVSNKTSRYVIYTGTFNDHSLIQMQGSRVGPLMFHYGPFSAWLSKPTNGNLETYKGDGQWFKILSVTGRTE